MPSASDQAGRSASQGTLLWAVRILAAETVAVGALSIFLLFADINQGPENRGIAAAVTLTAFLMAALLGWFGLALHRRRGWARGPAIVLNLLLLPIGYSAENTPLWWLGIVLMAVGLSGAGTLLAPATRAALGMR